MDLKTLILTMPGYVDATNPTDVAVLAWLQEAVTVQLDATQGDVLEWSAGTDGIARLRTFSAGTDRQRGAIADAALVRLDSGGGGLSLSTPSIQQMLSTMVVLGMFTQAEIDALNAGAQTTVERWQHPDNQPMTLNGRRLPNLKIYHIAAARAG